MIKISRWARRYPIITRLGIALLHILIIGSGMVLGKTLQNLGINISIYLLCVGLVLFIGGACYYPGKKLPSAVFFSKALYTRQKICDWMLAFSTFLMVGYIGNASKNPFVFSGVLNGASVDLNSLTPVPVVKPADNSKKSITRFKPTRAQRKAIFKELKKVLHESFKEPKEYDKNKTSRVGLLVLSIIAGVALSIVLAALSCGIACSGAETLAVFVLIFGAAGIAVLLTVTIKSIYRRYPQKMVPVPPKTQPLTIL